VRAIVLAICLVVVVASCGEGEPTLTEYAEEVEVLTTGLYSSIDDLTADLAARVPPPAIPTAEDIQTLYDAVAAAYRELRDGLRAIEPPEEVAEVHGTALEIVARLTAAEEAFVERAKDFDNEDDLNLLWETPEFRAADAAQDEIIAFCQTMQARFDATADREAFADVPWIPVEMQEVVLVAFGCDADDGESSG